MIDGWLVFGAVSVVVYYFYLKYSKKTKTFNKDNDMVLESENEVVLIDKANSVWLMDGEGVHRSGDLLSTIDVKDIEGNRFSGLKVNFLKNVSFSSKKEFEANTPLQSAVKINNGLSTVDKFWFNDVVSDVDRSNSLNSKLIKKIRFDELKHARFNNAMTASYVKRFISRGVGEGKLNRKPVEYEEGDTDEQDNRTVENNPEEQP